MKRWLMGAMIIAGAPGASAQEPLSLSEAVSIALEKNYGIAVARYDAAILSNNVTPGNAGFLPTVSLNAGGSMSSVNTNQKFVSGLEVIRNGVGSNSVNAGIALNWTLFDGMKMFATWDKLSELKGAGDLALKIQIENTVADVMRQYYTVVLNQEQMRITQASIEVYEERLKIAEARLQIGTGSKLDVSQARVDLNAQRSRLLNHRIALSEAMLSLNELMSRDAAVEFVATDSLAVSALSIPAAQELAGKNQSLLAAQSAIRISELELKENRSLFLPRLSLNAGYNFTRSQSEAGFALFNQNLGLTGGLTASWTLFNGFNNRRLNENAEISVARARLQFDAVRTAVTTQAAIAARTLELAAELMQFEDENAAIAAENLQIAMESFRLGSISHLQLREAQRAQDESRARQAEARYRAKLAEIDLLKVSGKLVR